jgi:iron complex transport system ATP-binding protein
MYGGSIELDGRSLHKISSRERAQMIGYVPQREEPLFEFSVREVAAMGRIPHSTGLNETEEDWEAVDQALEQTDVARLAEKSVMRISGGELQRTLIARAIAQGPKILLLDEPTASLDIPHWHDLSKIIRSLTASGTAVVISSHDINWALPLADSVICLNKNGTWQGPPSAAKSHLEEAFGIRLEAVMLSSGQTALYPVKPN